MVVESHVTLSPCPSAHELAELANGQLPVRSAESLRTHLDDCEACRVAVTRLVAPSSEGRVALPVGTEVAGRYRVVRLLGRGGMGEVHEAWDTNLERRVAVKVLLPRGQDRDDVERRVARLVRESKAMARLRHPNVVAVHDAGLWQGHAFVVMELVDGETLRAWLVRKRRSWSEVVEMFVGAGRGLAAAHAVGIVHRDFKPDNVLVDEHERPQVTDFGLARLVDDSLAWTVRHSGPQGRDDDPSAPSPSAKADDGAIEWTGPIDFDASGSLTQTGAAVGTPAYMAPEQFRGQRVDEKADVFGFCVALYEGLAGRRPFVGDGPRAILEAQWRGAPTKPLEDADVPRFVRDAVIAGLHVDPRARPGSIGLLLQRLQPRPKRRRWLVVAAIGAAICAAAGATALWWLGSPDPCELGVEPWDDARRRALAAVHADVPQVWARAETSMDRFSREWTTAWAEVCSAKSGAVDVELRRACLLGERRAFAAVLAGLDGGAIELEAAIAGIPRVRECSGERDLVKISPLPDEPEVAREVERIRDELAEIDGLLGTGQAHDLGDRIDALLERAHETEFRPIEAEVLFTRAMDQAQLGDPRAARATMIEAANAAIAGGHDVLAADAWTWLVQIHSQDLLDFGRGAEAAAQARAAIERLGPSPAADLLNARLRYQMGVLAWRSGRSAEALEELQTARRMAEQHDPENLDQVLAGIGLVLDDLGRTDEALAIERELIDKLTALHGPDHPSLASSYANLGATLLQRGDTEEALAAVDAQLRVTEQAYGNEHPDYGLALHNRGVILHALARWDEALEDQRRAREIFAVAYGPESSQVAVAIEHEAGVLQSMGRFAEAETLMRRALELHGRQQSWRDSARCRMNLADLLRESGHADDALAFAREAVAAFEADAPGVPEHAYALAVLGEVELELGRPGNASVQLERAVAMFDEGKWLPEEAALARFLLARALVASDGDVARARQLGESAVKTWNDAPPSWEPRLRKARTWLALLDG